MSQQFYGANISAAKFPMMSSQQGRSTIVQLQDNTFVPYNAAMVDSLVPGNERNLPQLLYCENVMPATWGIQAVGLTSIAADFLSGGDTISRVLPVQTSAGDVAYIAVIITGPNQWRVIVYRIGTGWQLVTNTWPLAGYTGGQITVAYVNTKTYIYFKGATDPLREYDFFANTLPIWTITGVASPGLIVGIAAIQGQLILHDTIQVFWSSLTNPIDFTPSLATGAGYGTVEGLQGPICTILPNKFGGVVYTNNNAVAMNYSGNPRYPYNFRDISGSMGVESVELVAQGGDDGAHCAYSTAGLQSIMPNNASDMYPDITEFLSGYVVESFDYSTCTFTRTNLAGFKIYKKLTTVANRYLVISYGSNPSLYAYAIIVDLTLGAYGKIKTDHINCFEWLNYPTYANDIARSSIVFVNNLGGLVYVDLSNSNSNASGLVLFGKFQFVRAKMMGMQCIEIESPNTVSAMTAKLMSSLNGKTVSSVISPTTIAADSDAGVYKTFWGAKIGRNHILAVNGNFKISALQLTVTDEGNVR